MTMRTQKLPMRLSQRHKRWIYAIGGMLFLSGLGWLIVHYFFAESGEFGETHHASEPWWLRLHGAAAMGFLVAFGSLLPGHIVRAWQARENRGSGLLMLGLVTLLILTGYGLYYAGEEQTRPWISVIHWITGMTAAAGLLLHVYLGKRLAARIKHAVTFSHASSKRGHSTAPLVSQNKRASSLDPDPPSYGRPHSH